MGGLRQILNEQVVPSGFCANKTDVGATSNPWDLAYTIGQTIGPNATFSDYISTIPNCPDCPGFISKINPSNANCASSTQCPGYWAIQPGIGTWVTSWAAFIDGLNTAISHHVPSLSNHFNYGMDYAALKNAFESIDSSYEQMGLPQGYGSVSGTFDDRIRIEFYCCACESQGPEEPAPEKPLDLKPDDPTNEPAPEKPMDLYCRDLINDVNYEACCDKCDNPNFDPDNDPICAPYCRCCEENNSQVGGEADQEIKPKKDEKQKEKLREGLRNILIEGRVEDAQQYFEKAVGAWPVAEFQNPAGIGAGTNLEGVLDHFVQNDPSGNNKYLMWMVKMYLNPEERGTSPNDISSLAQRFHKNVDRLSPVFIMNMDIFNPSSRISTSPKNIDSYDDLSQLERVMDEVDSIQTRKQKETEAKEGVDKLYEDERWLLVKPNTYEGSCYYGSSTKWCTASKDYPDHFSNYTKDGNLFYIIDKSKDLGDFYKIALYKKFSDGSEEWYDRADNKLSDQTEDAIYSMLPEGLVSAFVNSHEDYEKPEAPLKDIMDFRDELDDVMNKNPQLRKINTKSGTYALDIDSMSGTWVWFNTQNQDIGIYATPFWEGRNELQIDSADEDAVPLQGYSSEPIIYTSEDLENPGLKQEDYLGTEERFRNSQWGARIFLYQIYLPIIKKVLNQQLFSDALGTKYQTWQPQSHVSSYKFNYPPREGTMTQKFVDYLKQNTGKTANQFYEDILGYPRPRGHNAMFFAAIKDAGIVKMERQGRQFVYSLGPNYQDWVEGRLLRN